MFWIVIVIWVVLMAGFLPVQLVHIFSDGGN
jgi:succinate dehydrogenase / fumarate reductase cytochrome b subunit